MAEEILKHKFGSEHVNVVERARAYDGYFKIDRYLLRHRKFDGGDSRVLEREVLERGHVVAVLPIDFERKSVVLIEQFRPGAYAARWQPWLFECIAGIIEQNESPEDVAHRESLEEAACHLDRLLPIQKFLSSPGSSSETVVLYAASTDAGSIGGIHGHVDEGEDIRVHVVPITQAIELLDSQQIVNAKTVIALQWLARFEPLLSKHWFEQRLAASKSL